MTTFRGFRSTRSSWKACFALGIGSALLAMGTLLWLAAGPELRAQATDSSAAATAMPQDNGEKLGWGTDFLQWPMVTGDLFSREHGSRLAVVRVTPLPSAQIRVRNAEMLRHLKPDHVTPYPVGTIIAMQTWDLKDNLKRGEPGPIFFMKKEPPGYDAEGGDWRYAMTRPDFTILAEGKDGHATACRSCHLTMKDRDFVPAGDR